MRQKREKVGACAYPLVTTGEWSCICPTGDAPRKMKRACLLIEIRRGRLFQRRGSFHSFFHQFHRLPQAIQAQHAARRTRSSAEYRLLPQQARAQQPNDRAPLTTSAPTLRIHPCGHGTKCVAASVRSAMIQHLVGVKGLPITTVPAVLFCNSALQQRPQQGP